jgi:hypothetical protein
MTLSNVAFVPRFMTNIVSLSALIERGVHWNTQDGYLTRFGNRIAVVEQIGGHWRVSRSHTRSESFTVDSDDDTETETLLSKLLISGCHSC